LREQLLSPESNDFGTEVTVHMSTLDLGLLVLRLGVGLTFAAHGAQKAFGWWSGPGLAGWRSGMERMRMLPASLWAVVSAGAELVGGLLLAVGLLTPVAAAVLIAQSIVIIELVHRRNGFFNAKQGFEFPLALGVGAVAVALAGSGWASIDYAIGFLPTDQLRLAFLLVGILGALVALTVPRSSDARFGRATRPPAHG